MSVFKSYKINTPLVSVMPEQFLKKWRLGIETTREIDAYLSNCKDETKELFLTKFNEQIPDVFKNEVFSIKEASDLLMFNPESLRRKIRQNNLPTANKEEVGGRVGYRISGDVIVDNGTQIFQKQNLMNYCLQRYLSESIIVIMKILISEGRKIDPGILHSIFNICASVAYKLQISKTALPEGEVPFIHKSFIEKYISDNELGRESMKKEIEMIGKSLNKGNKYKFKSSDIIVASKEYNTIEEIEHRKFELEFELVELDIKLAEMKIKEIKDPEEMIKELQNRVVLEQKKSGLREELLKSEK